MRMMFSFSQKSETWNYHFNLRTRKCFVTPNDLRSIACRNDFNFFGKINNIGNVPLWRHVVKGNFQTSVPFARIRDEFRKIIRKDVEGVGSAVLKVQDSGDHVEVETDFVLEAGRCRNKNFSFRFCWVTLRQTNCVTVEAAETSRPRSTTFA